ncbi:hypothetical protein CTAYLR_008693 [Chrysophaeum taylorii]|uniref:Rhodanese domain-containing protein n=1 Tax=Chrysophaeum taylorii TaxID=2483200 RepID=A0AAD7UPF3_9STRA|nr:hypothetical protein CTAYLR_008693 [Chrysophaeum taylorii]
MLLLLSASCWAWSHLSHGEVARYSRHLILGEVGVAGQEKLKNSRVLCVGAGGLGSPAMLYLAAAGVGTITVVDDDVVEVSNLQRQIIHSSGSVGVPKTQSASETLERVNPGCVVEQVRERLTLENAAELVAAHDVVVDGSDNFDTKFLVDDACVACGKPNVYAAILRFAGQVSVFNYPPGVGATYRDVLAAKPPPGAVPSCAEGGVLGVLCGVLGSIQATEVVKLLIGRPIGETLANRLLCYDALAMRFNEIPLVRGARPRVVVVNETEAAAAAAVLEEDAFAFETIGARDVASRLADGWTPYVLDVRMPQEAAICGLPFADGLCEHRSVATLASKLPRDRDVLVHCKTGFRSRLACKALAKLGFTRLYNMEGGILAWARDVDPRLPVY